MYEQPKSIVIHLNQNQSSNLQFYTDAGERLSSGRIAATVAGRLEGRPEASSPLICVRMKQRMALSPDFCA